MNCEVNDCPAPVDRIDSGHVFCGRHGLGHLVPEIPIRRCEVGGCGDPTTHPGVARCRRHENWAGWPGAAA